MLDRAGGFIPVPGWDVENRGPRAPAAASPDAPVSCPAPAPAPVNVELASVAAGGAVEVTHAHAKGQGRLQAALLSTGVPPSLAPAGVHPGWDGGMERKPAPAQGQVLLPSYCKLSAPMQAQSKAYTSGTSRLPGEEEDRVPRMAHPVTSVEEARRQAVAEDARMLADRLGRLALGDGGGE